MSQITLDQAKAILNACVREELRDHTFGDAEVYWISSVGDIATGYFGREVSDVGANDGSWSFQGKDADALRDCGKTGRIERNDGGAP